MTRRQRKKEWKQETDRRMAEMEQSMASLGQELRAARMSVIDLRGEVRELEFDLQDHEKAHAIQEQKEAAARRRIAERETRRERERQDRRRRVLVFLMALLVGIGLVAALATPATAEEEGPVPSPAPAPVAESMAQAEVPTPSPLPPVREMGRYGNITEEERDLLARLVWLEARGESMDGQQAVAEVVLNRVAADNFPNTVEEVIFQGLGTKSQQFSPAGRIGEAEPGGDQYEAVERALQGESILPMDVVYFSRKGENDRVWGRIGNHVFCYQYIWK